MVAMSYFFVRWDRCSGRIFSGREVVSEGSEGSVRSMVVVAVVWWEMIEESVGVALGFEGLGVGFVSLLALTAVFPAAVGFSIGLFTPSDKCLTTFGGEIGVGRCLGVELG